MVATIGLIYPWMGSSLWHYRWRNCWFGDRRFDITGNWRAFALPYYAAYLLNVAAIGATTIWIVSTGGLEQPSGLRRCPAAAFGLRRLPRCLALSLAWYRATVATRMLSTVTLGDAKLTVRFHPPASSAIHRLCDLVLRSSRYSR